MLKTALHDVLTRQTSLMRTQSDPSDQFGEYRVCGTNDVITILLCQDHRGLVLDDVAMDTVGKADDLMVEQHPGRGENITMIIEYAGKVNIFTLYSCHYYFAIYRYYLHTFF